MRNRKNIDNQGVSTGIWDQNREMPKLTNLAFQALERMYDTESKLFAFNWDRKLKRLGPISERYSIIAAIGLQSANMRGANIPFSVPDILSSLLNRLPAIEKRGPGDLSLLLWVFSLAHAGIEKRILELLIPDNRFHILLKDLHSRPIVESAWTLTCFSFLYRNGYDKLVTAELCESIADVIMDAFNQETCLFSYCTPKNHFRTFFGYRNEFGNFASQAYSIYALSTYYQASGNEEALSIARRCADKICSFQGPYGQFWWIYNAKRGTIADKYPVFSVHQDGMGPMALKKLATVSKKDYSDSIKKSFDWLYGTNEMGISMILWEEGVILRCIQRRAPLSKLSYHLNMMRSRFHMPCVKNDNRLPIGGLEILNETRPYHMGWMLLFFYDS